MLIEMGGSRLVLFDGHAKKPFDKDNGPRLSVKILMLVLGH